MVLKLTVQHPAIVSFVDIEHIPFWERILKTVNKSSPKFPGPQRFAIIFRKTSFNAPKIDSLKTDQNISNHFRNFCSMYS